MNEWLATDPNRWFEPSTGVVPQHIDYMRTMEITLGIPHNSCVQADNLQSNIQLTHSMQELAKLGPTPCAEDNVQCCRKLLLPPAWHHDIRVNNTHRIHGPREPAGHPGLPWRGRVLRWRRRVGPAAVSRSQGCAPSGTLEGLPPPVAPRVPATVRQAHTRPPHSQAEEQKGCHADRGRRWVNLLPMACACFTDFNFLDFVGSCAF